jgi:hypothetical protein
MKIQLERKLPTCPARLRCVACSQAFEPEKIRSLLYDRAGLIQGDLCPTCCKLKANDLQQKLQSSEEIKRPRFYDRWIKQWVILSEAAEEIEQARLGASRCNCQKPRQMRIRFQSDDR